MALSLITRSLPGCVAAPSSSRSSRPVVRPGVQVQPCGHCSDRAPRHADRFATLVKASCDPLSMRTKFEAGFTMPIHSEAELLKFTEGDYKDKLVVLMCKSSHCKPCKAFMSTYHQFAERFADSAMLEITGDESPDTRKLMKNWEVKSTPTFRLYRSGAVVDSLTGTGNNKLLKAILAQLKDGERGLDWQEITHEDMSSDTSDDE